VSSSEARRLVQRLVSDQEFLLLLAQTEDEAELDSIIHVAGFDCTWQEVLAGGWRPLGAGEEAPRHRRKAS